MLRGGGGGGDGGWWWCVAAVAPGAMAHSCAAPPDGAKGWIRGVDQGWIRGWIKGLQMVFFLRRECRNIYKMQGNSKSGSSGKWGEPGSFIIKIRKP